MDHGPEPKHYGCRKRFATCAGMPNNTRLTYLMPTATMKARVNLELMMKRQLELRREETRTLHAYVTF